MSVPRKLHVSKFSPHFDAEAIKRVDKVFLDGTHKPNCIAYDMDEGWVITKDQITRVHSPKLFGTVTVTERGA